MGRKYSGEQSPVCANQGTPLQGSVKRPVARTDADLDEISSAKRQLQLPTMPPVKSPGASGGNAMENVDAGAAAAPTQFRFSDIVAKKQEGKEWTSEEIDWFVSEMVSGKGTIEDAQVGAWLMAVYLKNMTHTETGHLTKAMMLSGDTLTWPEEWQGRLVDKHSTGGVGDKVSLILAPALAACGMKVPMISGRGLGHTGGTLDKLESIPGYSVLLSSDKMMDILTNVGCCICGQTSNLVPADKKLYAIRDVTSTVSSLPLITASIISKKAAERVNALVLDVKVGKAALFSSDEKLGRSMATSLVSASSMLGTKASALMTRMDNPIGCCVGNALEVAESLQCLHGKGPQDLRTLVMELGGCLLDSLRGTSGGSQEVENALDNGSALGKFRQMITEHGVSGELAQRLCDLPMKTIDEVWEVLEVAKCKTDIEAEQQGYISSIDSLQLARVCLALGAGRAVADDVLDFSVGAKLLAHVGSKVNKGEPWITIYHQPSQLTADLKATLQGCVEYSDQPQDVPNIVIDVIRSA